MARGIDHGRKTAGFKDQRLVGRRESEFRKIIWPTRDDLIKKTGTVTIVSIVLGVIIAILDFLIQNGIDKLLGLF